MSGARFVFQTANKSALTLRKSPLRSYKRGDYIFEAEASNENIDFQKQVVLQRALWENRDIFLKHGVISYNHLHKRRGPDGQTVSDPSMIIGEPIEVRTEGKKTIVMGKLYHTSAMAQEIVKHLRAGTTRIKASVGGEITEFVPDGKPEFMRKRKGTITKVNWNDLALTISPVNITVSPVRLIKRID
jgi:hypothetical protein